MYDVAVIGAGISGAMVAMELARYQLKVCVLEMENDVSCGTTKANSAIIHAGFDPSPGSLMARLNVEGVELAEKLCHDLSVDYKKIGSLVVAFTQEELQTLEELYQRGLQNGVPGMKLLSAEETLAMEPNLNRELKGSLHAPTAAIVDPFRMCVAACENAAENGAEFFLNAKVTGIEKQKDGYRVLTSSKEIPVAEARYVVNAAGLYCDDIHNMVAEPAFEVRPNKGQYYMLDKSQGSLVNSVVFQCPTKEGKGVLVCPTVHGNLFVGPDSVPAASKEDVSVDRASLQKIREAAFKTCQKVQYNQAIRNFAGNRAKLKNHDFWIAEAKDAPGFVDVAGIQSPGLSAAPAIAKEVVRILAAAGMPLKAKENPVTTRKMVRFAQCSPEEKKALIEQNPLYGRVICRCQTVTEGEVVDQLRRPIPPRSLDAVKRRCGAGLGRCQGGFCGPRVQEIIARESGLPMQEVVQDKAGSYIITGVTKGGEHQC